MDVFNVFTDLVSIKILFLILASFISGFIDSVIGGGGLIQLPALLIAFPNVSLATLFGTNKIAALSGTFVSALQYSRRVKYDYKVLLPMSFCAAISSFVGAKVVNFVDANTLKFIVLFILIAIVIYNFLKKDLGSVRTKNLSRSKQIVLGSLISLPIGFYDGFFGPGTGSFFVLSFVALLGYEFIEASAYSKVVNCITNIFALAVFVYHGSYLIGIAVIMAIFNITGSIVGTHLALRKGNNFVRALFFVVVSMMIFSYGYDVLFE